MRSFGRFYVRNYKTSLAGIEPTTLGFGDPRSIRLSYKEILILILIKTALRVNLQILLIGNRLDSSALIQKFGCLEVKMSGFLIANPPTLYTSCPLFSDSSASPQNDGTWSILLNVIASNSEAIQLIKNKPTPLPRIVINHNQVPSPT